MNHTRQAKLGALVVVSHDVAKRLLAQSQAYVHRGITLLLRAQRLREDAERALAVAEEASRHVVLGGEAWHVAPTCWACAGQMAPEDEVCVRCGNPARRSA